MTTEKVRPEAFAILSNAAIVLARAAVSRFLDSSIEGVGPLFEAELDGQLSLPAALVVVVVVASDARTGLGAHLATLEARAVQLQTPRTDAIAGRFAIR